MQQLELCEKVIADDGVTLWAGQWCRPPPWLALHFESNKIVPSRRVLLSLGVTVALGIAGGELTMIAQRIGPREEPAVDVADSDALTREQAVALVSRMTGQYGHWVPDMMYYNPKLLLSAVVGETPGGTATSPKGCMQNIATPDPVAKHRSGNARDCADGPVARRALPLTGLEDDVPRRLLSIAMPTRNRPGLLERALGSVLRAAAPVAEHLEVTVSDGSDDDATGQVVQRFLADWRGGHRYVRNRPALSLVDNMNRALELSSGDWAMQLDDDDYLLPGAGAAMVDAIRRARTTERVLMFGVEIVDAKGIRHREQRFRREQYLEPQQALRRLLGNSSFVREPAVVVRRSALEREGLFDTTVGDATDTDMWVRLFSRYGVRCLPQSTCAYTIHEAAATTGMWNPATIKALGQIFDRAVASGVVPERTIRRWQATFFHQFILAGAYRRLRVRRRAEARDVLRLFDLPEVRNLGASPKWLPVRAAFTVATVGARPVG